MCEKVVEGDGRGRWRLDGGWRWETVGDGERRWETAHLTAGCVVHLRDEDLRCRLDQVQPHDILLPPKLVRLEGMRRAAKDTNLYEATMKGQRRPRNWM